MIWRHEGRRARAVVWKQHAIGWSRRIDYRFSDNGSWSYGTYHWSLTASSALRKAQRAFDKEVA